jgi:hypothetical protein
MGHQDNTPRAATSEPAPDGPASGVRLRAGRPANESEPLVPLLDELAKEPNHQVLATQLRPLVRQIRAALTLEDGPDGLLESILVEAPRLERGARRLRQSRAALAVDVRRLERYAAAHAPLVFTRYAMDTLSHHWMVHVALERALLQEALLTDLGEND